MSPTDRLILGHMPFVGVSYQSAEKDEEYHKRFSKISATRSVLEAAIKIGVQKFAGATPRSSPLSRVHLEVLELMIAEGYDIELLTCIECMHALLLWSTSGIYKKGVSWISSC